MYWIVLNYWFFSFLFFSMQYLCYDHELCMLNVEINLCSVLLKKAQKNDEKILLKKAKKNDEKILTKFTDNSINVIIGYLHIDHQGYQLAKESLHSFLIASIVWTNLHLTVLQQPAKNRKKQYNFFFLFWHITLSVLLGHLFFSSLPQRPMTSDFEGFPSQILSITL